MKKKNTTAWAWAIVSVLIIILIASAENIGFALESNYLKQAVNDISIQNLNITLF